MYYLLSVRHHYGHRPIQPLHLEKTTTTTEYLIELNLTGTLPDEIDEIPTVSAFHVKLENFQPHASTLRRF